MLNELNEQVHKQGFKQTLKNMRNEENSKKSIHPKAHGNVADNPTTFEDKVSE